ncbi:MAG: hypothetical protein NTY08_10775 [Proteobacteria bacterium]|nr:hypothetical protein [Pseudomonadota bacterium]
MQRWSLFKTSQRLPHFGIILLLIGCGQTADNVTKLKTDLGSVGNQLVADTFERYRGKAEHCRASSDAPRVLVTGFGLFSGVEYNISGAVVSSFADPNFTASDIDPTGRTVPLADAASGRLEFGDFGGRAKNRTIRISGQQYELCLLTLDVLWDLAAAIVIDEAHAFRPDLIIMTGRGRKTQQAVWEGYARNQARAVSGYLSSGASAEGSNLPVDSGIPVLPSIATGLELRMSWDNTLLKSSTEQIISDINPDFTAVAPATWSPGNDYVCNNISFVALAAREHRQISLSGGTLSFSLRQSDLAPATKIGFLHLPSASDNNPAQVMGWIKVLAKAIHATLASNFKSTLASDNP